MSAAMTHRKTKFEPEAQLVGPQPAPADGDAGPVRRCAATGVSGAPSAMVRFVAGPDGALCADLTAQLPGRGVWVTASAEALALALRKKAFQRGLGQAVKAPEHLAETVIQGLRQRCLDAVSLARRAGEIISGYDRVADALGRDAARWALVIEAQDAAANAQAKMRGQIHGHGGALPVLRFAEADALGRVLGRERCVHAVMARGGLAARLAADDRRLEGFTPALHTDAA